MYKYTAPGWVHEAHFLLALSHYSDLALPVSTLGFSLARRKVYTRVIKRMAVAGKTKGGVPALGWWLMAVATVRLGLTWSGFFNPGALGSATYGEAQSTYQSD